jgi:hypothetical protein
MVKLAHELEDGDNYFDVFYARRRSKATDPFDAPTAETRRHAA